jgi:hypothetical protein
MAPSDHYTSISLCLRVCVSYTVYLVHFLLQITAKASVKCKTLLLPVDRGRKFLRNAGSILTEYTLLHSKNQ